MDAYRAVNVNRVSSYSDFAPHRQGARSWRFNLYVPRASAELYDPASGRGPPPAAWSRDAPSTPQRCCLTVRYCAAGGVDCKPSKFSPARNSIRHQGEQHVSATAVWPCQLVVGRQDSGRRAGHKQRHADEWSIIQTGNGRAWLCAGRH